MRRALLALVLVACVPPEDEEPLACRNAEPGVAELGTGDLAAGFIPLADGDDLPISFGPQGMHMVVVSVRVTDLEAPQAGGLGTEVSIGLFDGDVVVGGTFGELEGVSEGNAVGFLGIRAVITEAEVDTLAGRMLDVVATVRDGCGRELEDTRNVRFVK